MPGLEAGRVARRRRARCLLAAALLWACVQPHPGPLVGSETHFLVPCSSTCEEGSECLCGVCTRGCSESAECAAVADDSACVPAWPRTAEGRCPELGQPAFCDRSCLVDGDCARLGHEYRCRSGYCRVGLEPAPTARTSPCTSPGFAADELMVFGDSIIELSPFTRHLETQAMDAGVLAEGQHFRQYASAMTSALAEGPLSLLAQYADARRGGTARVVVMDGGETDMFQGLCSTQPLEACPTVQNAVRGAETLLGQMAADGVVHVVYFFYPDPIGNPDMKAGLDVLRPLVQNACGRSALACHWIDLRPLFADHPEYLAADGLVFSDAGASSSAAAVWERLTERCILP